ncbi:acrylyl-CoA reductase family protein [Streptomyces brasiliensis]|uniref:Zinc-binding dehydrogenase n=1 Tax=Streptomyces brasiliensis TaxID=1954 RepID=A0A917KZD4_9ACTN|nr:acryloyl-CoA reductase [Streptomyces brasiliensis]GGJ35061.1 zinc-binding dehydrogenase [Streptomyces brasiliensis]
MSNETSLAYRITSDGHRVRGDWAHVPIADVGAGELLIRTSYSSVNFKDALAATGAGKVVRTFPLIGGIDVVGVVAKSTDGRFQEGDEVVVTGFALGEEHDGGYSQWVRVPADWAVPLPDGMTAWESMALGTAGITAALAIHRIEHNGLLPDEGPVAVTGASGGTGSLAVSMLAGRGYDVAAVTGKEDAHDYLRRLGAGQIVERPTAPGTGRPLESARWAGAVDAVGGDLLTWLIRTTERHGSIATFGNVGGHELSTSVLPFILRGINLLGVNTGYFSDQLRRQLWQRMNSDLRPRHLNEIARTIDFHELPDAFDEFLTGRMRGRVVVRVNGRT